MVENGRKLRARRPASGKVNAESQREARFPKIRPTKPAGGPLYAQQNTPNKTRSGPRPFSAGFSGF
jgi:hypothetical protein